MKKNLALHEQRLLKKIELIEAKKQRIKNTICEGSAPTVRFDPDPSATEILEHPLFHINDYSYFRGKGYNDDEILKFWDRDLRMGVTTPNDWNIPTLQLNQPAPEHPTRYPYLGMNECKQFAKCLEKATQNKAKNNSYKKYMKEANDIAIKTNFKNWRNLVSILSESAATYYFLYVDNNPNPIMTSDNYNDLVDEQKYWENLGHEVEIRDDYSRTIIFDPGVDEYRKLMLGENEYESWDEFNNSPVGSGVGYFREPKFKEPRTGTFKNDYRIGDIVDTSMGTGTIIDIFWKSGDYLNYKGEPKSRTTPTMFAKVKLFDFEDEDGDTFDFGMNDLKHTK